MPSSSFCSTVLYLDGEVISAAPLHERKERPRQLLSNVGTPLQYSDHQIGRGAEFYTKACELSLEGIISKRPEAPYSPGNRGLWVKVKCQNREEFVVVGWTDPEGARPWLAALLLAYYDPDGRLVYAGASALESTMRS
jgi:bifunctional non-homologous end joining protein LigD